MGLYLDIIYWSCFDMNEVLYSFLSLHGSDISPGIDHMENKRDLQRLGYDI